MVLNEKLKLRDQPCVAFSWRGARRNVRTLCSDTGLRGHQKGHLSSLSFPRHISELSPTSGTHTRTTKTVQQLWRRMPGYVKGSSRHVITSSRVVTSVFTAPRNFASVVAGRPGKPNLFLLQIENHLCVSERYQIIAITTATATAKA